MKKSAGAILVLVMISSMALALAGCGDKPQTAAPADSGSSNSGIVAPGAVEPDPVSAGGGEGNAPADEPDNSVAAPQPVQKTVTVYFTDENIEQLIEKEREITFEAEADRYKAAFKALQTADEGLMSLWEKVVLNGIQENDGLLTIDITLPDEARLGAGGEALAIEALTGTFFQFDEVKQLELTVDGQKVESLMGHVELEYPYNK